MEPTLVLAAMVLELCDSCSSSLPSNTLFVLYLQDKVVHSDAKLAQSVYTRPAIGTPLGK